MHFDCAAAKLVVSDIVLYIQSSFLNCDLMTAVKLPFQNIPNKND